MELMARHKPRLYRDANNNVLGITADNMGALPYADLFGVQDGDIVHKVNGVTIDSIETAFGLVDRFKNEKTFEVVVLRNGAPHTLHLSVP